MTSAQTVSRQRVTVWFGSHIVLDYSAGPEAAADYADSMSKRYAGLQVKIEDLPDDAAPLPPLPCERLWGTLTP